MTTIYIIRHAQAFGNVDMRINGHTDSQLTEAGRRQLIALRERFDNIAIDAIYSSDLSRARDTARALAEPRGLPVTQWPELREQHFGDWEGLPLDTAQSEEEWCYPPNGENRDTLCRRMAAVMGQIAERHPNQTVAVVSHGAAIRAWQCHLLGVPITQMWTSDRFTAPLKHTNTSVTCVARENGAFNLRYLDDVSHLDACSD